MKGSTMKRCGCPVEYTAKGRRKACAKDHGSWYYVIDVGRDPKTGRRSQKRKGGFATQAEAAAAMAEAMTEVDQGRYRFDGRQTVRIYLEQWIANKATEYRPTTYVNAKRWIEQTLPYIGHLRLRDLQPAHISSMLRTITASNMERGIGTTTTRRILAVLSSALSDAKRENLIKYNPAQDAWRPKEHRAKVNPWTGQELGAFLDHSADDALGSVFELMGRAALRRGEALGLRWADVDLDAGELVVRQQVVQLALPEGEDKPCATCGRIHRNLEFGPPKTDAGDARRVSLGQLAVGALLAHQLRQTVERDEVGDAYSDHDLVFADPLGDPWRPNHVTKRFLALVATSGLRKVRLHDLRHCRISLHLEAGDDMVVASKMAGHSRLRTTSDSYSHLTPTAGKAAAERADALILRRPRDQSVTSPAPKGTEALPGDPERASDLRELGGAEGTRTPDPLHAMQESPLSGGDGS